MTSIIILLIDFKHSNPWFISFWIVGFSILNLNVSYCIVSAIVAKFLKLEEIKSKNLSYYPKSAIVYVVKNETEILNESIPFTFNNNDIENTDLWILSNSNLNNILNFEKQLVDRLGKEFGINRIKYFQSSDNPLGRKHICLNQWMEENGDYKYILVCDADSLLPKNTMIRLMEKAEHPANQNIAVFQSQLNIANPATRFSKYLGPAQEIAQRIYTKANQIIFDRGVFYGSGALLRLDAFSQLDIPENVLSHDIWDTAYLDQSGYKIVFCPDVISYESYPNNYIESINRDKRWIKGTIQSIRLIFLPRISIGTRFYVTYPIYSYLSQPLFLLWIMSGMFAEPFLAAQFWEFQGHALLGARVIHLEMGPLYLFTIISIVTHRFIACKNVREILLLLRETLLSLLLCLNNVIYDSIFVITAPFTGIEWQPMKKNAFGNYTFFQLFKFLWPSTLLGMMGICFGLLYSHIWMMVASPFLISFTFSIPITFWTQKRY